MKLGLFSSCKGVTEDYFARAGSSQDADMLWRSWAWNVTALQQVSYIYIYIYVPVLFIAMESSDGRASQGMKLSCLACSKSSQETGPQYYDLNYISVLHSPSSTLTLQLGSQLYCRNSHHAKVQKQHLLLFLPVYWAWGLGLFWFVCLFLRQNVCFETNRPNKSIGKAFK